MRKAHRRTIQIQERDLSIFRELLDSTVLTTTHLTALFFEGRKEAAKKRLAALKSVGLISDERRRRYEPSLLLLTKKGERLLNRGYQNVGANRALEDPRRNRPSEMTLKHELEVADVKVAFKLAIARSGTLALKEFCTRPSSIQFTAEKGRRHKGQPTIVKPDGFMVINEIRKDGTNIEHAFFIEVDRSTDGQRVLAAKAASYRVYYRTGGFAERSGGARHMFRRYPFRVLMIFRVPKRRENTERTLLSMQPPIRSQVWLATIDAVRLNALGSIWRVPREGRQMGAVSDGQLI